MAQHLSRSLSITSTDFIDISCVYLYSSTTPLHVSDYIEIRCLHNPTYKPHAKSVIALRHLLLSLKPSPFFTLIPTITSPQQFSSLGTFLTFVRNVHSAACTIKKYPSDLTLDSLWKLLSGHLTKTILPLSMFSNQNLHLINLLFKKFYLKLKSLCVLLDQCLIGSINQSVINDLVSFGLVINDVTGCRFDCLVSGQFPPGFLSKLFRCVKGIISCCLVFQKSGVLPEIQSNNQSNSLEDNVMSRLQDLGIDLSNHRVNFPIQLSDSDILFYSPKSVKNTMNLIDFDPCIDLVSIEIAILEVFRFFNDECLSFLTSVVVKNLNVRNHLSKLIDFFVWKSFRVGCLYESINHLIPTVMTLGLPNSQFHYDPLRDMVHLKHLLNTELVKNFPDQSFTLIEFDPFNGGLFGQDKVEFPLSLWLSNQSVRLLSRLQLFIFAVCHANDLVSGLWQSNFSPHQLNNRLFWSITREVKSFTSTFHCFLSSTVLPQFYDEIDSIDFGFAGNLDSSPLDSAVNSMGLRLFLVEKSERVLKLVVDLLLDSINLVQSIKSDDQPWETAELVEFRDNFRKKVKAFLTLMEFMTIHQVSRESSETANELYTRLKFNDFFNTESFKDDV
ncbi:hypothetical protein P9112_010278 [Eukaryota sp. TZLM1-RC]